MQLFIIDLSTTPATNLSLSALSKAKQEKLLVKHQLYPETYVLTIACENYPSEERPQDMLTLGEWLASKRLELDKSDKARLAGQVRHEWIKVYGSPPRVIARPNSEGRYITKASGFPKDSLYLLELALHKLQTGTLDYAK